MKILLDECVDPSVATAFTRHTAVGVLEAGFTSLSNGELLTRAQTAFDAFVTVDTGIPYQQNLAKYDLIVVLLRLGSNRGDVLRGHVPSIEDTLDGAEPGSLIIVEP